MKTATLLAAAATAILAATAAHADSMAYQPETKGTFLVDLRATDVIPEADNPIVTAAGVDTGLRAQVGDSIMPTLGLTYFFTDQISLEVILGVTSHNIYAVAPSGAKTQVSNTWVLPPVVTVQFHPLPKARISPYVGVGINGMLYFSPTNYNGYSVRLTDSFGYAFQAGFDVPIEGRWSLNVDAKKVFTTTTANIDNGALSSNVTLNPWVVSLGIGYKF